MGLLNSLSKWLATQLDKLKIKNPIAFISIQALLGIFLGLFANDSINIPTPELATKLLNLVGLTDFDGMIVILLGGIIALIGPRTTALLNQDN